MHPLFRLPTAASASADEAAAFLQRRLGVFGKTGFLIVAGFCLFTNLLHPEPWLSVPNLSYLGLCAAFGLLWAGCARGAWSADALRAADAAASVAVCLLCAVHGVHDARLAHADFSILLGVTNTLVFRAVTLPSTPARTAAVSVASAASALLYMAASPSWHPPGYPHAIAAGWAVVAVVTAVATSQVIYGLRREVREARRLGQYTLEEKIGEGGMGEVWRASHSLLRRPTAVKLLNPAKAGEGSIARFEREVQNTSRLTHPNTVAVYDFGRTPEGVFYYAMELLPGLPLDAAVREGGPMPPARAVHVLRQACASLAEAHGMGLVHRDIKPANLILCERGGIPDVLKVVDFGLVKDSASPDPAMTAANTITGTPHYLSPEAIESPERVDARSDLYALGAVGYWLLTGRHVFEAESLVGILGHHLHSEPALLDGELGRVLRSCLEKDPALRPASAEALSEALAACAVPAWSREEARAWWKGRAPAARDALRSAPTVTVLTPR